MWGGKQKDRASQAVSTPAVKYAFHVAMHNYLLLLTNSRNINISLLS